MMDDAGLALLRSIESLMKELLEGQRREADARTSLARIRRAAADRQARGRAKEYQARYGHIFARDGNKCTKCGATENLSIDHIIPRSKGGTDDPSNLRVLCKSCNSQRCARTDEEWDAVRGDVPSPDASLRDDTLGNVSTGTIGVSSSLEEKKKETPPTPIASHHVTPKERVWAFWQLHLGKASHSKFDRKRQKAVEARLRDGYTVDQLCEAIQGCKLDPFSMGKNDRNQRFDDLSLICRDAAHVDKFIALAPRAAPANGAPRLAPWEQHAKEDEEVLARHGIGKAS